MIFQTPVVLVIFNRPELTEIVFESIRQVRPGKLLVVADGPRSVEDAEKCERARAVIKRVDWDCQVLTNYSDENLGAGLRIAGGLDWAFSVVEEAIILEDDCLPAASFFNFCQVLLEHYRYDERIMHISGNNFQSGRRTSIYSYYFSKHPHCWGWASWRRAWEYFDHGMRTWPAFRAAKAIESVCEDHYEQKYWVGIFDRMYRDAPVIDVWDYQWTYACWSQNALAILPCVNLVSNLGYDRTDATHTSEASHLAHLPTQDIWEITHPPLVFRDREADAYTFDNVFNGRSIRIRATVLGRLLAAIARATLRPQTRRWLRNQLDRLMWPPAQAQTWDRQTEVTRME